MVFGPLVALATLCTATVTKYELLPYDSLANPLAIVHSSDKKARFTFLTDRLVRMEYSKEGTFEDRATLAFVNRNTPVPRITVSNDASSMVIKTDKMIVTYANFSAGQLSVAPTNGSTFKTWTYGETSASDKGNLRGTFRTLDRTANVSLDCTVNKAPHCEYGLISRSGWALVDDTGVPCFDDDDWWSDENGKMYKNAADVDNYLFAYSDDFTAAIRDYTLVGGKIPIFPRNNHGVWFTRWYDFENVGVRDVVQEYADHGMPLDVMVLDMNWHKKDDWSGFSWDRNLYPFPADTLSYLHSRGLTVAANLHDATGIGKWEDLYLQVCEYMGLDPNNPGGPKGVPFTLTNKTYVYALEDIVLRAVEKDGMDFWWIDWQQGESAGNTGQDGPRMKMNPTIWTDKMRVTDSIRRCKVSGGKDCTNKRGVVHARWGGLGNHRYQHGFSGDVKGLTWYNLAYQAYFSATASNVGWGFWSHDIEGPGDDHEMYSRWIQLGSWSGIMRSHDRGMSAGGCAKFPSSSVDCSNVRPYNVPKPYEEINKQALVTRSRLLPYIYTQTKVAFESGLGITRPMYYYWPKEDNAYPVTMDSNLGQHYSTRQYMFGDQMLVAPVTASAGCTGYQGRVLDEPCGLTMQQVWVPPGNWVERDTHQLYSGPKVILRNFTNYEVPVFVKAGAIIPEIPVRSGDTIGLASRQYSELVLVIYPGGQSGTYTIYEDDGHSYEYLQGKSAEITASYIRSGTQLKVTVSTNGTFTGQLPTRKVTVRVISSMAPTSVSVDGAAVHFSRWGGDSSWSFDGSEGALIVEGKQTSIGSVSTIEITSPSAPLGINGMKGKISRARLSKGNLDETRNAPGANVLDPAGAPLSRISSMGDALSFLAGSDVAAFTTMINQFPALFTNATNEISSLAAKNKNARDDYSAAILQSAA